MAYRVSMGMPRKTHITVAVLLSVAFHTLLGVLVAHISMKFPVEVPTFVELSIGQVSSETLSRIIERDASRESPAERAQAPKRKELEIEEPTVSALSEEKLAVLSDTLQGDDRRSFVAPQRTTYKARKDLFFGERKATFVGRKIDVGIAPGQGVVVGEVGAEATFTIEGEIQGREILFKPFPPKEEIGRLEKEVDIKIGLGVRPNGYVGSTRPLQKGDIRLENLTMTYLKQWRFAPLEDSERGEIQTGVITFHYRFKSRR